MKKTLWAAIGLTVFLVLSALWYFLVKVPQDKINAITTFEQCAKEFPILMTYPAQCNTPDGRHFVEVIPSQTPLVTGIGMANPASLYCEKVGGTLKMVDSEKGQMGECTLPNGKICEEWALFRGECK